MRKEICETQNHKIAKIKKKWDKEDSEVIRKMLIRLKPRIETFVSKALEFYIEN